MAHRSQCSSAGDNPLDPNYLPPHYREEYRMAIDALVEADLEGYYGFLQEADVVDFLSSSEIDYIKGRLQAQTHQTPQTERRYMAEDVDGSSDTYWPLHSDHDAPSLDLGWPQQLRFVGPTEVTTLVNPSDPEMPSIKEQVRRMIKNAQQVIAVVMDMFTDVDIFADILDAAARGVAVYVLLDELNAQHFVAMVNNCRVNLDEMKFMRVRTVSGSTYFCRTGKTFKGQMMDRFILVDCRAVLSGNYSFMWSFEKIHRCLAHLFLGQLVATFDEEFRILFAHSEPLVVENVLANMPQYSSEPESYYSTEKAHMFNRQYPNVGMGWAERTADVHMNVGHKMLPFRSESIHSVAEANPSLQRHMNMHAAQQYTGDHQFMDHGRQMKGPNEMVGFKRHSYGNIPDFEYMPPQNPPTMRGNQYMEEVMPHSSQFAREPRIYQGPGLQSGYDIYGRFRGQGHNSDQFPGSGYPHEGDEAEPTGGYDHVQRYLQSHSAMEEGHVPRNLLPPVQSSFKRHSMGHSYTCQTSPKQPNMPEQKRFFNANRKPQDVSQKQGLRDWRISSYLCAYDDAQLDLAELEGSNICDEVPCFTQEAPCVAVRPEIRPGNRDFNRIPSPREHPTFVQIQDDSTVPESSGNHLTDLPKIHFKTTPTSTSESSCTTEGDKTEETENREPKETNRISEEFLKRKPSRPVQRGSRLRHSLIFSSNLELNTPEEMKDTPEEKEGDEASKLSARVSHILDKRRTGSPFQPFQWSNFVKSATFDNSATESAQPEEEQNKAGDNSDSEKVKTSQNPQKRSQQEKDPPQTQVPEGNSQRTECPSNVLQKSSSFIDMNDPDCRLRYFKELAAKRKLAAAKSSQANPVKATQKFALPEKPSNNDSDKTAGPVFKTPETPLKSKNTTTTEPKIKDEDTKCEESSKNILHRATDAEKIRIKKKLAEESGSTLKMFQDTDPPLKPIEEATVSTAKNQTSPILNISSQKPFHTLSDVANSSKNQVDSVAFNTASIQSSTTLYHIPNETYPSHAIQTQSVPPVNLPQTQSLNTTPNEGCISANDSQTLAQGLSKMFSTCSDSVSIDSTPNLAIVDTGVPSKPNHIDTGLSPACSTVSFSQCPFKSNVDSSQSLKETDCSKHTNAVWTESCVAESSQHPSATEENPSQHHTSIESESSKQPTPTGNRHSQKSISANSSQQPTALREDSFQHPTVTESKTSQNFTITTEADSFQQPTESESSQIFTAITIASSQQTTKTSEYSSQSQTKAGTDISQHSTSVKSETSIKPTVTGTHSLIQPNASGVASLKHPNATETGSSQNTTSTVTYSSQQNTSIEIQKPIAVKTDKDISQQSIALVVDAIQQLMAPEEDTHQHHTATENEPFEQTPVLGTGSLQEPTAAVTGFTQQSTEAVTNFPQQPTATVKDSSQKSSATDMDLSQKSTVTVTNSSLKLTATITNSSQQPTPKVADSSQHPSTGEVKTSQETGNSGQSTAKVTNSSLKSTATDSFQQPTPTEPHSLQQSAATEVDSSQQSTAKEIDNALQSTATDVELSKNSIGCFQQPVLTETESSHQPAARETDSSQQTIPTEADSSHRPTPTVKGSPQQPTPTGVDSSRQPATTETDFTPLKDIDSSQQPTPSGTDASLKPSATAIDSCQQPAPSGTDSSQQPTTTDTDSSQQPTPSGTDASLKPSATAIESCQQPAPSGIDSSQQPTTTDTDSSQQPTPSGTDASLKPSATAIDSCQQPTPSGTNASLKPPATAIDFCQQPAPTGTDSSQQPTRTETGISQQLTATENDSPQQHTATETENPEKSAAAATDSFQRPVAKEIDSNKQLDVGKHASSQNLTKTGVEIYKLSTETEKESLQYITATNSDCVNEKKDTNVSEDFNKVIPIPHVNIAHTDNIISQNTVGHSHSDTVTPCDSQVELNQTQAQAKPFETTMIKNNSALTSFHSVELSSAQPQGSEEPSLSFQEITQFQTNIANSMESSCLNDPIPEKTDGYQKNETITEQPQTHDTSAIAEGPEIALIDVSKAIVPNEVDKTNLTPQEENSPTILAEISANSCLTAASNLENPPGVAENSTIMSTHQSSTANVISCSNLRDDTKVLLEQISAKNQSRSTQSKQPLAAASEAKGGEISPADKLFSNYSGRTWSSKATPEEREILLQKMEKMRKERKVYSRFEAS